MSRAPRTNADVASQLQAISRRQFRRRAITAGTLAIAVVVTGVILLLALDWRGQRPGGDPLRFAATIGAGAILLTAVLWGLRTLRSRPSPLAIARQLDASRDEGDGVIASGWAFAHGDPDDPRAGSAALRRATVLRAAVELESIDPDALLPQPRWRLGVAGTLVVGAAIAATAALAPAHVHRGLTRLANPWSDAIWPRDHVLQFVDAPALAPRSGAFVAVLIDANGALPQRVVIQRRSLNFDSEPTVEEFIDPGDRLVWRQENLQESFEYRAFGGDDHTMPWRQVTVAEPPEFTSWWARITPPKYTGMKQELTDSAVRAIAGSHVDLQAEFYWGNIKQARLLPPPDSGQKPLQCDVDGDFKSYFGEKYASVAWIPTVSGDYRFEVVTLEGMRAVTSRSIPIEVVPDRPPDTSAATRRTPLFVLPTASVPVAVRAHDDLGLASARLEASLVSADASGAVLWQRGLEIQYQEAQTPPLTIDDVVVVPLDAMQVEPGQTVRLISFATDSVNQTAASLRSVELRVVHQEQLLDLLAADLAELVELLLAAQSQQRTAIDTLAIVGDDTAGAGATNVAASQAAVRELLLGPAASALTRADELYYHYAVNGLTADAVAQQLDALQFQLTGQAAPLLDQIEEQLAPALSIGADGAAFNQAVIGDAQQQIAELLASVIAEFKQWSTLQQVQRELAELATRQEKLAGNTAELARAALGAGDAPSREELQRGAADQRGVMWRLEATVGRIAAVADRLDALQPGDAARLRRVRNLAEELQLVRSGVLAAGHLQGGRLAAAATTQRHVVDGLAQLLAALSEVDTDDAGDRLQQLEKLQAEVAELRREAESLAAAQDAEGSGDDSSEQSAAERDAAAAAADLARQAQRLAPAAAKPLRDAARALQQSDPRGPADAVKNLADAEAAIAAAAQEQQTLLAELNLRRLAGAVGRLIDRQGSLNEQFETVGPSDNRALQALAIDQAKIASDTVAAAETVESLPVFVFGLQLAAAEMRRAKEALHRSERLPDVRDAGLVALRRLKHVAAAIVAQQNAARGAGATSSGESPEQRRDAARQQRNLAQAIAQIRLLRGLQAELEQRTAALRAASGSPELLQQLQSEQQELAELAQALLDALEEND